MELQEAKEDPVHLEDRLVFREFKEDQVQMAVLMELRGVRVDQVYLADLMALQEDLDLDVQETVAEQEVQQVVLPVHLELVWDQDMDLEVVSNTKILLTYIFLLQNL